MVFRVNTADWPQLVLKRNIKTNSTAYTAAFHVQPQPYLFNPCHYFLYCLCTLIRLFYVCMCLDMSLEMRSEQNAILSSGLDACGQDGPDMSLSG